MDEAVQLRATELGGRARRAGRAAVKRNHWVVRLGHWVSVLANTVMVGSGLQTFDAYPAFARKGETFCCYPWAGKEIPASLTFGGWLAGARNWHFVMMWALAVTGLASLAVTGLAYLAFLLLHGESRRTVSTTSASKGGRRSRSARACG
jgi:thiosulfate reductase cytochrome b subunit